MPFACRSICLCAILVQSSHISLVGFSRAWKVANEIPFASGQQALLPPKCGKLCRHLNVTKFVATKMGQTLSPPKTHHNHGVIRKLLSRTASTKTFVATTTTKTCVRSQTKTTKRYAAASKRKKRAAFTNEDLPFCSQTVQPRSRFPTRLKCYKKAESWSANGT